MFELSDLLGPDADRYGSGTLEIVDYVSGSPATGALYRLRAYGTSRFCKVLQHVRHWPGIQQMPPEIAADFIEQLPWRSELELWDPGVVDVLPDGLRAPVLHRLVELPDDRVAVWMEDVVEAPGGWDLARFERAAYLLGRWNARSSAPEVLGLSTLPPGYALRMYATNAVCFRGLGPLASDDLWSHPWLAGHGDMRADLRRLGPQIPEMLDRLDTRVQSMPHGDASPQNLLVPADDPDSFVVIDLSFRSPHALGFDLGQLLVGLTHAGKIPAARLPEVAATIIPAYLRGLGDEGITGEDDAVRDSFATATMLRSGFDGLLYGLLDDSREEDRTAFDERIEMSRFLTTQYLEARSAA